MHFEGEEFVNLSQQSLWDAMHDVDILKTVITGCDHLEWTSEESLETIVVIRFGPLKISFNGTIELQNRYEPERYRLIGSGQGKAFGGVKAIADINLIPEKEGTSLQYQLRLILNGKIAKLGAKLMDKTAERVARDFFAELAEEAEKRRL